jgi:nicotinamide N-methyltransferase
VWFTPYRPWLIEKDLDFFRVADEGGLAVEKMFEKLLDKPLFKNDPGVCLPYNSDDCSQFFVKPLH